MEAGLVLFWYQVGIEEEEDGEVRVEIEVPAPVRWVVR